MRKFLYFIMVTTLFAMAHCANTDKGIVPDGTILQDTTVKPYADWVSEQTGTPIKSLPIVTASYSLLQHDLTYYKIRTDKSAAAIYIPGRIVINNTFWNEDSPTSQSYLVHELVHHAQLLSRKKYPCTAAKEREAYTLQNKWLTDHGDPELVTNEWITKISTCKSNSESIDQPHFKK